MTQTSLPRHGPSRLVPATAGRWWILGLLSLAQFMVILDVTVVNVALPVIAEQLNLDRAALTWVVTAYTVCFGGLMMLGGRLADIVGRRGVFLTGLVLFTVASLFSGLADDPRTLIAARAAQGVGAALLSPAALSIVTTTFHGPDRTRALGVWAALGGAGAALGVLLGGVFTAGPGWRWVFFINVPVGVLVAILLPMLVAGRAAPRRDRIDVPGALAVTGAVAALIYGLVRAGDTGWRDTGTVLTLVAGLILLLGFIGIERAAPSPLIRLALLTRRRVIAGFLVMLAASALLLSLFFLSSQYLQHVLGLGPLQTGLLFLPVAVVIGLGSHVGVRVVRQVGGRPAAAGGFLLTAVGALLLTQLPAQGNAWLSVLPGFAVAGFGLGAAFVAATTTAMTYVDPHEAGMTSGLVNTGHELGAGLGIAFVSTLAAASLDAVPAAGISPTAGYATAFTGAAVVAAVMVVLAGSLVPAGRAPVTDEPVFAH